MCVLCEICTCLCVHPIDTCEYEHVCTLLVCIFSHWKLLDSHCSSTVPDTHEAFC